MVKSPFPVYVLYTDTSALTEENLEEMIGLIQENGKGITNIKSPIRFNKYGYINFDFSRFGKEITETIEKAAEISKTLFVIPSSLDFFPIHKIIKQKPQENKEFAILAIESLDKYSRITDYEIYNYWMLRESDYSRLSNKRSPLYIPLSHDGIRCWFKHHQYPTYGTPVSEERYHLIEDFLKSDESWIRSIDETILTY